MFEAAIELVARFRPDVHPCASEIGAQRNRVNNDAGVEDRIGVKESFECAKGIEQLLRVHDLEKLASRSPVPVFARERTAVGDNQTSRVLHERSHSLGPRLLMQWKVDAHVDTTVTEVPVGIGRQLVLVEKLVKVL